MDDNMGKTEESAKVEKACNTEGHKLKKGTQEKWRKKIAKK